MDKQVQIIIASSDIGCTELRKYPKETLVQTILEMKKSYSSEAIRLKEMELEIQRMTYNMEMKKIDAEVSNKILNYSNYSDNKYAPMAVSSVTSAVSNIMGAPIEVPEEVKKATDLEIRIDLAVEQGLRWNSSNKRPGLNSTVLRKLEAWEKSLEGGRGANSEDYVSKSYDEILEIAEGSEAFIVGLCETMEESLGIEPPSKYLKTRFKRDIAKLYGNTTVKNLPPDYEKQASGLAEKFWGNNTPSDQMEIIKEKLTERIEKAGGVQNITVRNLKGLCTVDRLPTAIEFPSDMRDSDKHRGLCWSEKYDDRVQEVIDDYVKEIGL